MGGAPSTSVGPGLGAFVAFLLLALALWLLMRNMNARMRRMAYREQQRVAQLEGSERLTDVDVSDQHGEPGASDQHGEPGASDQHGEPGASDQHGEPGASDQHGEPGAGDGRREAETPDGLEGRPSRPAPPRPAAQSQDAAARSQEARDEPTP